MKLNNIIIINTIADLEECIELLNGHIVINSDKLFVFKGKFITKRNVIISLEKNKPILDKHYVKCNNKSCCNPKHLTDKIVRKRLKIRKRKKLYKIATTKRQKFADIHPELYDKEELNRLKEILIRKYGNVCMLCKATTRIVLEHIKARYRGGTNQLSNLQLLCWSCNFKKGLKEIDYRNKIMIDTRTVEALLNEAEGKNIEDIKNFIYNVAEEADNEYLMALWDVLDKNL